MHFNANQFSQVVLGKLNKKNNNQKAHDLNAVVDSMPNLVDALDRYQGYYSGYFHALGYP